MAKKKAARKKSNATKSPEKKNSLVANINRRKKAGTSRSKQDSTISPESYQEMKQGWPNSKKSKKKSESNS